MMKYLRASCSLTFIGGAFLLSGCGFQPLYQQSLDQGVSIPDRLTQIKIAPIADRSGQILRNYLLDSLMPMGEPHNPQYRLEVKLVIASNDFSFRTDSTPRRTVLTSSAHFQLKEASTRKVVYQNMADATTAFAIGAFADTEAFSTITSEKKEIDNGLRLLANDIKQQLATYFAAHSSE